MNIQKHAETGFTAGILIHTREGLVPIENIKVGDWVLAKPDGGEGEVAYKRVLNTFAFDDKEVWLIGYSIWELQEDGKYSYENSKYNYETGFVVATGNHPFWVAGAEDGGNYYEDLDEVINTWLRADRLELGMHLLLADGRVVMVAEVKKLIRMQTPDLGWMSINTDVPYGYVVDFNHESPELAEGSVGNPPIYPTPLGNAATYLNEDVSWLNYDTCEWLTRKVYNIEVEDCHRYFVDKLGIWVR